MNAIQIRTQELDDALVATASKIRVLSALAWPVDVGIAFLENWERGRVVRPRVSYQAKDYSEVREELIRITKLCDRGDPVQRFLFDTAQSYVSATRMMECVGRPSFTDVSVEIYGRPSDAFNSPSMKTEPISFEGKRASDRVLSNFDVAKELLVRTEDASKACTMSDDDLCVTPAHVVEEIRRGLSRIGLNEEVEVLIEPTLSSKAAAGGKRIRIRGGTCFSNNDIAQLLQHEAFVHTVTLRNGRAQPHLKTLGLGAPRTTETQEGLAVFAELITGAIDLNRLRRLASRVVATQQALEGADFVDVFRFFLEMGQIPGEAYHSAMRIFRGGDGSLGAVFTKDAVYLRGLVRVHSFMRRSILQGQYQFPTLLTAGRMELSDVSLLSPSFESGYLEFPKFCPPWVQNRSTLLGFLLFSSLSHMLHLDSD